MRPNLTDFDAVVLQRELELRRHMRTNYLAAAALAGVPATRRKGGGPRALLARLIGRQPAPSRERLETRPQPAA